ncbi:hypothetical protein ACSDQ9_06355 [Aestuariimicrobium soli]|uniref:hypothetical protein n=1 Tax=Aestuariimicrobium soli TaxID=2035834 RepID=UPI003EBED2F4
MTVRAAWARVGRWSSLLWLGLAAYWLYVWRRPIWGYDDLHFATRSDTPFGRIDWSQLPHWVVADVARRNGRTADIVMQLLMSVSPLVGPAMALFGVGLSWAIWRVLMLTVSAAPEGQLRRVLELTALLAAIAVPFTVLAVDPTLNGTVVMFMSANVGYVLGAVLALVAVRLLWGLRERGSGWWRWPAAVVLACFAGLHHELLATAMAGCCVGLALVTRRRQWRVSWVLALVVVLGFSLARFSAGGLWARSRRLGTPFPVPGGVFSTAEKTRAYIAYSLTQNLAHQPLVFAALVLAVAALAAAGIRAGRHPRLLTAALATLLLGSATIAVATSRLATQWQAGAWLSTDDSGYHRAGQRGLPTVELLTTPTGTLVLVCAAVLLVALGVVCLLVRDTGPTRPLLPMLGVALGPTVMAVVMGTPGGRTMYLGLLLTLVAATQIALAAVTLTPHPVTSPVSIVAALVVAVAVGPAAQAAPALVAAVDRNIAVWQGVERQLTDLQAGRADELVFPRALPEPLYSGDFPGDRPFGLRRILQFYGLPESTPVVFVPK